MGGPTVRKEVEEILGALGRVGTLLMTNTANLCVQALSSKDSSRVLSLRLDRSKKCPDLDSRI